MKIYVCWGTWTVGKPVHAHPCGEAHKALAEAGYSPEVIRSYGLALAPGPVNELTRGRREVKEMTGNYWVPVLVTDDETVVQGSKKIIAWAKDNPAGAASDAGAAGVTGTGAGTEAGAAT